MTIRRYIVEIDDKGFFKDEDHIGYIESAISGWCKSFDPQSEEFDIAEKFRVISFNRFIAAKLRLFYIRGVTKNYIYSLLTQAER